MKKCTAASKYRRYKRTNVILTVIYSILALISFAGLVTSFIVEIPIAGQIEIFPVISLCSFLGVLCLIVITSVVRTDIKDDIEEEIREEARINTLVLKPAENLTLEDLQTSAGFIAVNCVSRAESIAFKKYLNSLGIPTNDDLALNQQYSWNIFGANTCYYFDNDRQLSMINRDGFKGCRIVGYSDISEFPKVAFKRENVSKEESHEAVMRAAYQVEKFVYSLNNSLDVVCGKEDYELDIKFDNKIICTYNIVSGAIYDRWGKYNENGVRALESPIKYFLKSSIKKIKKKNYSIKCRTNLELIIAVGLLKALGYYCATVDPCTEFTDTEKDFVTTYLTIYKKEIGLYKKECPTKYYINIEDLSIANLDLTESKYKYNFENNSARSYSLMHSNIIYIMTRQTHQLFYYDFRNEVLLTPTCAYKLPKELLSKYDYEDPYFRGLDRIGVKN